jgi:hypothetical protein
VDNRLGRTTFGSVGLPSLRHIQWMFDLLAATTAMTFAVPSSQSLRH